MRDASSDGDTVTGVESPFLDAMVVRVGDVQRSSVVDEDAEGRVQLSISISRGADASHQIGRTAIGRVGRKTQHSMVVLIADIDVAEDVDEELVTLIEGSIARCRASRSGDTCHDHRTGSVLRPLLHPIVARVQDEDGVIGDKDTGRTVHLVESTARGAEGADGDGRIQSNDDDAMVVSIGDVERVVVGEGQTVVTIQQRSRCPCSATGRSSDRCRIECGHSRRRNVHLV